jgi:hypothetical protein
VQLFLPVIFVHSKAVGRNNFAYRVSGFWRRTQSERKVTPYHVRIESTTLQCQGIFPRSQDYSIPNRSYRSYFGKCMFWRLTPILRFTFINFLLSQQPVSTEDSESVNDSLLLIRNILHVPERPLSSIFQNYTNECSQQNRVVWNLFVQGFDRLLINLLASSHKVPQIT